MSAVKFAMVAPVTTAPPQPGGSRSNSALQAKAISSSRAATGDMTRSPAFCPQALASQAAPSDAGRVPPITKPKYLRPAVATEAAEPASSSRASTSRALDGDSGSAPPIRSRPLMASAAGDTERSPTSRR